MQNTNLTKSILKFFCGPPKTPQTISTRKEAEKAFLKATKVGIKAGNHYYNADKAAKALEKTPSKDQYISMQLLRAELREKSCLSIIVSIKEFFAKKHKLKKHKAKMLNDMLEELSKQMNNLENKINELKSTINLNDKQ